MTSRFSSTGHPPFERIDSVEAERSNKALQLTANPLRGLTHTERLEWVASTNSARLAAQDG